MNWVFWAGLILGALTGLAVDLWKRPLDRLLDRRLEHRSATRGDALVQDLRHDRQALRDYLTEVVLQTTLVSALVGILAGIAFGVTNALSWLLRGTHLNDFRPFLAAISILGQLIAVLGAAYIVRVAANGLAVARRVNPRLHNASDSSGQAAPSRPREPDVAPGNQPPDP